jgi:hypothetical protein
VLFEPVAPGDVEVELEARFTVRTKGHRGYKVPEERLSIVALGRDVPIKVEEELIDMKACFLGLTYRSRVVVRNDVRELAFPEIPDCVLLQCHNNFELS